MYKINELIIASNNAHKIAEIKAILGEFFEKIYSLKDKNINVEIEETGKTFEENAIIKATEICRLTGLPALSDDSGLEVDALCGAPGVYSARYAGEPSNSENNNKKLLDNMRGIESREAHFTTVIALCFPSGDVITAEGKTFGRILTEPQGENGFGYDPLFYSNDLGTSFAVATAEQKNAVSHRGRALAKMKNMLKDMK